MNIEIRDIKKEDHSRAIDFAIRGMHFDWYLDSPFLLRAYGRYFWYLEMNRATEILAAYVDGRFTGVLMAEIYGRPKQHHSPLQNLYVRFVDFIQRVFFSGGAGLYEDTVKDQLAHYLQSNQPDGEIIFLAADPDSSVKGVGSALLSALEKRTADCTIFLHTDDACTWQFYERRGFQRVEETDILMELPKGQVPLKCLIYAKEIKV